MYFYKAKDKILINNFSILKVQYFAFGEYMFFFFCKWLFMQVENFNSIEKLA